MKASHQSPLQNLPADLSEAGPTGFIFFNFSVLFLGASHINHRCKQRPPFNIFQPSEVRPLDDRGHGQVEVLAPHGLVALRGRAAALRGAAAEIPSRLGPRARGRNRSFGVGVLLEMCWC